MVGTACSLRPMVKQTALRDCVPKSTSEIEYSRRHMYMKDIVRKRRDFTPISSYSVRPTKTAAGNFSLLSSYKSMNASVTL